MNDSDGVMAAIIDGADLSSLYSAARQEGVLNLYAAGPIPLYKEAAGRFEKQFPGIEVNLVNGFSDALAQDIDAQRTKGRLEADIAILQTIQDFDRWNDAEALEPFKSEGFDRVFPAFKASNGAYVGIQVYGITYGYNSTLLSDEDVPRSATGFLDPKFEGRIVSGFPHRDDVVLYLFHTIIEKYGWEYMDRFMKNRPKFILGHAPVARVVASGEFSLTLDAIPILFLAEKRRGSQVEIRDSREDAMPVWAQTCGIFRGAPHAHAARLFLTWYLSKEQQELMARSGTWSSREDVAPPESLRPLADYKLANHFREFIENESLVSELRKRFEQYTGPAAE